MPWSEASFRNEIDHQHGISLVAERGKEVVGYGVVWVVADEAHITTIAVDPEQRRQGIAWKLMVELLERAKERGATCATLEVRASNEAAIKLYERLGFEVCGRRRAYYADNKEDAMVMWLYELEPWQTPTRS